MKSQVISLPMHILFNYIFVRVFDFGVVGCGIASNLTYAFLLFSNIFQANQLADLDDALRVSIYEKRVWTNLREYLSFGVPNLLIIFLDWACFEMLTLFSGYFGIS